MRFFWLSVAIFVAGCDTGSIGFMAIPAETVVVEGSTFDVRRKDDQVELIRTNMEFAPSLKSVVPRAAAAVTQVTGCAPVDGTWSGDAAMMRVTIDCQDGDD